MGNIRSRNKMMARAAPVTGHEKTQISSVLSRTNYNRLDELCKKLKTTKSEFIRRAVLDEIKRQKDE